MRSGKEAKRATMAMCHAFWECEMRGATDIALLETQGRYPLHLFGPNPLSC